MHLNAPYARSLPWCCSRGPSRHAAWRTWGTARGRSMTGKRHDGDPLCRPARCGGRLALRRHIAAQQPRHFGRAAGRARAWPPRTRRTVPLPDFCTDHLQRSRCLSSHCTFFFSIAFPAAARAAFHRLICCSPPAAIAFLTWQQPPSCLNPGLNAPLFCCTPSQPLPANL